MLWKMKNGILFRRLNPPKQNAVSYTFWLLR